MKERSIFEKNIFGVSKQNLAFHQVQIGWWWWSTHVEEGDDTAGSNPNWRIAPTVAPGKLRHRHNLNTAGSFSTTRAFGRISYLNGLQARSVYSLILLPTRLGSQRAR